MLCYGMFINDVPRPCFIMLCYCICYISNTFACRHEAALEKVRAEGRSAAESGRGDVVQPLKEEVERMRQQLEEAQAMYDVRILLFSLYLFFTVRVYILGTNPRPTDRMLLMQVQDTSHCSLQEKARKACTCFCS